MSISTKIITFAHMVNATVCSASSEASGFPAGNLVVPAPNCYWKSNQADHHHQIVLDIKVANPSNVMALITAEEENSSTLVGIDADVEFANTADGTWTSVENLIEPGIVDGSQIKLFRYDAQLPSRYWRVTLNGYDSPDYYPPDQTKLYGAWIGREWTFNRPYAWPTDDTKRYELVEADLPYGMKHLTPLMYAPSMEFDRRYLLTGDDITAFNCVMIYFNGMPVIVQEGDDLPFLASIVSDFTVTEMTPDVKIAEFKLKTIPVLDWSKAY